MAGWQAANIELDRQASRPPAHTVLGASLRGSAGPRREASRSASPARPPPSLASDAARSPSVEPRRPGAPNCVSERRRCAREGALPLPLPPRSPPSKLLLSSVADLELRHLSTRSCISTCSRRSGLANRQHVVTAASAWQ